MGKGLIEKKTINYIKSHWKKYIKITKLLILWISVNNLWHGLLKKNPLTWKLKRNQCTITSFFFFFDKIQCTILLKFENW